MYQGICIANCESKPQRSPIRDTEWTQLPSGDDTTRQNRNGQNNSCIFKLMSAVKTLRNWSALSVRALQQGIERTEFLFGEAELSGSQGSLGCTQRSPSFFLSRTQHLSDLGLCTKDSRSATPTSSTVSGKA